MRSTTAEHARLRLRPEFAIVPLPYDKVLLRSPDQGVRISVAGLSSARLVDLLRALDGRELSLETHAADVRCLLQGLIQRDIVEVNPAAVPSSSAERLFARFDDDPGACAKRLRSARVLVCGRGELAEALLDGFGRVGVEAARRADTLDRTALRDACSGADLTVAASEGGNGTQAETLLNDIAIERGLAWLPVRIFGAQGLVGPLFVPGDGPCHACMLAREEANWIDPGPMRAYLDHLAAVPSALDGYGRLPGFDAIIGTWAVIESTKFLSRFTMPVILGHVLRIELLRCAAQVHRVLRLPRCPCCSPLARRPSVNSLLYAHRP